VFINSYIKLHVEPVVLSFILGSIYSHGAKKCFTKVRTKFEILHVYRYLTSSSQMNWKSKP